MARMDDDKVDVAMWAMTRAHVLKALQAAVVRRPVMLAGGGSSQFYIDARQVTLGGKGLAQQVGHLFMPDLRCWPGGPIHSVGGMASGAIPLATAIACSATNIGAFFVRQRPKEHGLEHDVENCPPVGARVVIVDDVVTTGASLLRAAATMRDAGCVVAGAMVLVTRAGPDAAARVRERVGPFTAMFSASEVGVPG